MNVHSDQPMSPQQRSQLDDALRAEIEKLLKENQVWQLGAYGWLNAHDADPEFIGHAMWQTDPPVSFDHHWSGAREPSGSLPSPEPKPWQRMVAESGADFDGLMNAARMSIGLFLFQVKLLGANLFGDDSFYDLHRMSSVIYLAMASERLREFLIAAVFRKSLKAYGKGKFKGDERILYETPFLEAKELLASSPKLAEALGKAEPLAREIRTTLRESRNELVHELATAIGHRERQMLDTPHTVAEPDEIDFDTLRQEIDNERQQAVGDAIKQLVDWYSLLARASNEVFIAEHYCRQMPD